MRVGSVFTGIGGADLGLELAGMRIAWQCELDPYKQSVLKAHWPDVPLYDDVTTVVDPPSVDLMIGGFPCQDLSIAGKRKGFTGERSVLAFEFLRIAESLKPRWIVLENVPGLLSSNKGLDFHRLLSEMVACGYGGLAWRCLDARYFGVPQRRRRIFIVARRAEAGDDPRAASRLALRALCESGSGDLTSCVTPWQEASRVVGNGAEEGRIVGSLSAQGYTKYTDQEFVRGGQLVTHHDLVGFGSGVGAESGTAIAYRKSRRAQSSSDVETWVEDDQSNTLNKFDVGDVRTTHAVVSQAYSIREDASADTFSATPIDTARCLQRQQPSVQSHHAQTFIADTNQTIVRRLSPLECERLMGLPDHFTAPEGVKASDSKRYAACGDAIVVNVAYWIGQRIMRIEQETL